MPITHIAVRGARQHNLRDISLRIPRNSLTVLTGLSGSGKSSLAFDTIYAEGQRRYVETLSPYARQFLDQIERPDVDSIEGLSPAIAIEQKTTSRSPRSTVGTITEIYDYLRLLYASIGVPHCPRCDHPIRRQSAAQIVERILSLPAGERVTIYAPVVRGRKGEFREMLDELDRQGFRARIDGELRDLAESIQMERRKNHTIEAVVDRVVLKPGVEKRLEASVTKALQMANGLVLTAVSGGREQLHSSSMACPDCGFNIPKLEPRSFSFNSTYGACPECHGLGNMYDFDAAKVVTDWSKPLLDGGLGPGSSSQYLLRLMRLAAQRYKIDLDRPFDALSEKQRDLLMNGPGAGDSPVTGFHGVLAYLRDNFEQSKSESYRDWLMNYMSAAVCPACRGKRLRPEALAVRIGSLSIADFAALTLQRARETASALPLSGREALIAERLRREIVERLGFLNGVGLGYLSLDRGASTLSGGEGQRIRLATQIGSRLRGVLYVLDEPSIGLHQRDNRRLIEALKSLRDLGNTVLVVEHDEDTIRRADHVIDLGPGAGILGGQVVGSGTVKDLIRNAHSTTGHFLRHPLRHPAAPLRPIDGRTAQLKLEGISMHNVSGDVSIPLGRLVVITGVSGSGKSTVARDVLYTNLRRLLGASGNGAAPSARRRRALQGNLTGCRAVHGLHHINRVLEVDQAPIGKTPRSCPATYIGFWDDIRRIFAATGEARLRGYTAARFSFNTGAGRCEACEGQGVRTIEMSFLPDVKVLCEVCGGRRFNSETLSVLWREKSIGDVLAMNVDEAVEFFQAHARIHHALKLLQDVGLGYLTLGQQSPTLSGGEAQRIKLVTELAKVAGGATRPTPGGRRSSVRHTLYVLDEPTVGLHMADVEKLIHVLHRLVDAGNTAVVVEHNLDVMAEADWIVDMGPEAGDGGGHIVAEGAPAEVVRRRRQSHTGRALWDLLEERRRRV